MTQPVFPFTAVVGQETLKRALLLVSVDAHIGGLLISGPRGSAKSTAARSLADLLYHNTFVTLPLGATEEMVIGSLNLKRALNDAEVEFRPGLIARANGGVLYVDEVNLLPDHLVDVLLDVCASGRNVVERDGISHEHDARFVLIGTMNPDEGELRPQLLDRFGLSARVDGDFTLEQRQQVVDSRVRFDRDPAGFVSSQTKRTRRLLTQIEWARAHLDAVTVPGEVALEIATRCRDAGVDGLRADITLHRAARAWAALQQREAVRAEDLDQVQDLVFDHRRSPGVEPAGGPSRSGPGSDDAGPDAPRSGSSIRGAWGAVEPQPVVTGDGAAPPSGPRRFYRPAPAATRPARYTPGAERGRHPGLRTGGEPATAAARGGVNWFETLADRATAGDGEIHYRFPERRSAELDLVVLDTSSSTLAGRGLVNAKGVVKALAARSYMRRRRLGLVTFGNDRVQVLLHPQRAPKDINPVLDAIRGGGGTPLSQALRFVSGMVRRCGADGMHCHVFLLTDGRVRHVADTDLDLTREHRVTVVDIEASRIKLAKGRELARSLDAEYVHVESLTAAPAGDF